MQNWILKKYIHDFKEIKFNLHEKLSEFSIPIRELDTFVDWDKVNPRYNFFYDYEGNEMEIKKKLIDSPINDYSTVILEIGCGIPTIEINTSIFINHWEDFVSLNGYSGIFIITNDYKYFIEFTDDSEYQLFSNFLL